MYVCICNAIKERELRSAARNCDGNAEAVYHSLGCIPLCGSCLSDADRVIDNERENARLPALLPG